MTDDPYAFPALYDLDNVGHDEDVAHYVGLARAVRGTVLELGAGTGRLTLPIARAGVRIEALDRSAAMLERLRARLAAEPDVAARVRVREEDLSTLDDLRRHGLVVLPFNTLHHLPDEEAVAAVFGRMRRAVHDRGVGALDAYLPTPELSTLDGEEETYTRLDPASGRAWDIAVRTTLARPGSTVVTTTTWTDRATGRSTTTVLRQRLFPLDTLRRLARAAGWVLAREARDFSGRPARPDAWKWVAVLRPGP